MYQVEWIIKNHVVLFRAVGDQTIEDVEAGVHKLQDYLSQQNREGDKIHVVNDSRYMGEFPTKLGILQKLMKQHPNAGRTAMIGGNRLTKFFSSVLTSFAGGQMDTFDDFESAMDFLIQKDSRIPSDVSYKDLPPLAS